MNVLAGRYLNEIISITIMLLMTTALIAGQADATVHESVRADASFEAATLAEGLEAIMESTVIRADVKIELDLDKLLNVAGDSGSRDTLREIIEIKLKTQD